ncbi:MAG: restriction endonuclease subunit S [Nitrosotalea sp.]
MQIIDLFTFKTGTLPALEKTEDGDIPLVYGTTENNGIKKYVKVNGEKQIFQPPLITVSYLGTAFVQVVPFTTSVVDKSNIIILDPKQPKMSLEEMYFYTYQINRFAKFGYHYGRRMNMRQLEKIKLVPFTKNVKKIKFGQFLPKYFKTTATYDNKKRDSTFVLTRIDSMFTVKKGKGAYREDVERGHIPLISATTYDNGIIEYVNLESTFNAPAITVERVTGQAFVQLRDFATVPDDISVLIPKDPKIPLSFLFYIASLLNDEKWRYSYSRKLSPNRIQSLSVKIPMKNNKPDYELIDNLMKNHYGWQEIISSHHKLI